MRVWAREGLLAHTLPLGLAPEVKAFLVDAWDLAGLRLITHSR